MTIKKQLLRLLVASRHYPYTSREIAHNLGMPVTFICELLMCYESLGVVETTSGYGYGCREIEYAHWRLKSWVNIPRRALLIVGEVTPQTIIHKRRGDTTIMRKNWIRRQMDKVQS